jgi:hypothetical protein
MALVKSSRESMVTRPQQILIKRAQREAGLVDAEYRDALETVSGCRTTTDPRMTDRHVDLALAYFEAIYWRGVDSGALPGPCKADAIFRQRGFWAAKNPGNSTSRDRYATNAVTEEIAHLESALADLGFSAAYCAAIREKIAPGCEDVHSLHLYKAALRRTLKAKQKKANLLHQMAAPR